MTETNDLRINEWIQPNGKNFCYKIFWPYADEPLENDELIDVYVKLDKQEKRYVGTFLTPKEFERWFKRFKENGEYSHGSYIPLGKKEILLEKISNNVIEKTLEHLISESKFSEYFESVDNEES